MKRFSEQFKKQSTGIRLSAAERRDLKERLVSYMEYHPLPSDMAAAKTSAGIIKSEPYVQWRIDFSLIRNVVGSLAVITLIVVPIAAERTVPGDVLYPVKVRFNEEVRSTLALSPYEKVEWETERLERRIAEARLLANEGKLTDEVKAEVAEAVKVHSDAAQKEIALIRETDSDEAAIAGITFASALEVQSQVLERDLEEAGVAGARDVLAVAVETARADAAAKQGTGTPSYPKLLARLEEETTRAEEYLISLSDVIEDEDRAHVRRRLEDIARKVLEATTTYNPEDAASVEAATTKLTAALADTRKLISFMTDIEVSTSVEVEDLVPVTLTDEERRALLVEQAEEIAADRERLLDFIDLVEDQAILSKLQSGLNEIDEALVVVEGARATTSTLIAAEIAATDAQALIVDMYRQLEQLGIDISRQQVIDEIDTEKGSTTPEKATTTDETTATSTPEERATSSESGIVPEF